MQNLLSSEYAYTPWRGCRLTRASPNPILPKELKP